MGIALAILAWVAFCVFVLIPAFFGYCLIWAIVEIELKQRKRRDCATRQEGAE